MFVDDVLHQRQPQFSGFVLLPQAVEGQTVAVSQILGGRTVVLQQQADTMLLAKRRDPQLTPAERQSLTEQLEQLPQRQHQAQGLSPHQQLWLRQNEVDLDASGPLRLKEGGQITEQIAHHHRLQRFSHGVGASIQQPLPGSLRLLLGQPQRRNMRTIRFEPLGGLQQIDRPPQTQRRRLQRFVDRQQQTALIQTQTQMGQIVLLMLLIGSGAILDQQ